MHAALFARSEETSSIYYLWTVGEEQAAIPIDEGSRAQEIVFFHIKGLLTGSTPMGSARKPRKDWNVLILVKILVRFCVFWPRGGRNRVDTSEICRNQSLFWQTEPSGPEM